MNTAVSYLPSALNSGNATESDIRRVFDRQRDTALRLRTSTCAERLAKITRLRDALLAHRDAIRAAALKDFRKPAAEVDLTEILPIVMEANDARRHLKKWMKPKGVMPTQMMFGTKGYVQYEPKGRCLIISPWNYPVNLTFGPLVSCIAAGNTAILKPSEMTPNLSAVMVKITREIFSEDEVAIFEGDAAVSTTLLSLPWDHIFFTGSPAIGKVVMAAASKHLTSVTLELGGKSPTIIDESADLPLAAKTVAWAKYTNNGQTCIAPDHVYVHAAVKDEFVRLVKEYIANAYGEGAAAQRSPALARVVNERHTQRVNALLEDAKARGAVVLTGDSVDTKDCFIAPTLLTNIPRDAKIMDEEIFGPLLPIIPFTNLDQVIGEINAMQKPLALYVWSRNEANIEAVMKRTSSGGACINHAVVQFLHGNLPFGGVNNSGIGNAHGEYGFRAFSHERAVVRTRIMLARMFFLPHKAWTQKIIDLLMKLV
ncbi:MAG: aldehyde dehydrogenase family protein [Panacagrimonas sp.]|jgi:aldehyde dehydrogenase (NAD+)|nr:aldehyde dehydrogenase family protein [Panacagrimonas sp.]MCC2656263.1 aldehyde dehydrogenase family protein [Panacagrimonas sp.]